MPVRTRLDSTGGDIPLLELERGLCARPACLNRRPSTKGLQASSLLCVCVCDRPLTTHCQGQAVASWYTRRHLIVGFDVFSPPWAAARSGWRSSHLALPSRVALLQGWRGGVSRAPCASQLHALSSRCACECRMVVALSRTTRRATSARWAFGSRRRWSTTSAIGTSPRPSLLAHGSSQAPSNVEPPRLARVARVGTRQQTKRLCSEMHRDAAFAGCSVDAAAEHVSVSLVCHSRMPSVSAWPPQVSVRKRLFGRSRAVIGTRARAVGPPREHCCRLVAGEIGCATYEASAHLGLLASPAMSNAFLLVGRASRRTCSVSICPGLQCPHAARVYHLSAVWLSRRSVTISARCCHLSAARPDSFARGERTARPPSCFRLRLAPLRAIAETHAEINTLSSFRFGSMEQPPWLPIAVSDHIPGALLVNP